MVKLAPLKCKRCDSTAVHVVIRNGKVGSSYITHKLVKCDNCGNQRIKER